MYLSCGGVCECSNVLAAEENTLVAIHMFSQIHPLPYVIVCSCMLADDSVNGPERGRLVIADDIYGQNLFSFR